MNEKLRGFRNKLLSLIGLGTSATATRAALESTPPRHEPAVPTPKYDVAEAMRHGAAKWATWASESAPNRATGKGPGRRRERRRNGVTARQQRLQRQREPGKPHDRIDARRYVGINLRWANAWDGEVVGRKDRQWRHAYLRRREAVAA